MAVWGVTFDRGQKGEGDLLSPPFAIDIGSYSERVSFSFKMY